MNGKAERDEPIARVTRVLLKKENTQGNRWAKKVVADKGLKETYPPGLDKVLYIPARHG